MKKLSSLFLCSFLVIGVVTFLIFWLKVSHISHQSKTKPQGEVAVILGTRVFVNGRVNQCLVARLEKGIQLLQQKRVRALIMTGGRDKINQPTQAQLMASLARYHGVAANVIWTENNSSDTWENIAFAKKIIQKHHWNKILIVSEPYHLPRAVMIAHHFNLEVAPIGVTSSQCWQNKLSRWFFIIRDFLAYLQDSWRIFSSPALPE